MRRGLLTRRAAIMNGLAAAGCAQTGAPAGGADFASIEERVGGRLGVAALNTANGAWLTHRAEERFALCSTFKCLAAAGVLYRTQIGELRLDQPVHYTRTELLPVSPVTTANVDRGWMSLDELCAAAIEQSDNTAGNLLLANLGGPAGLTGFLRAHGDATTRLDRTETGLNENLPGDLRDTTTPRAMATTLSRFLTAQQERNETLDAANAARLVGWMERCQTGLTRLRAGLPQSWRVGDKTGAAAGEHNANNDVAIAFPPGRPPILIASFMSQGRVDADARGAAHADVARIIAETWS
jgi:beta-lactamase class A